MYKLKNIENLIGGDKNTLFRGTKLNQQTDALNPNFNK